MNTNSINANSAAAAAKLKQMISDANKGPASGSIIQVGTKVIIPKGKARSSKKRKLSSEESGKKPKKKADKGNSGSTSSKVSPTLEKKKKDNDSKKSSKTAKKVSHTSKSETKPVRKANPRVVEFLKRKAALEQQRAAYVDKVKLLRSKLGPSIPRVVDAPRAKTHWDCVLEEMLWMATDFIEERKFKQVMAIQLAHSAKSLHESRENRKLEEQKLREDKHRRICSRVAGECGKFWERSLLTNVRHPHTFGRSWSRTSEDDSYQVQKLVEEKDAPLELAFNSPEGLQAERIRVELDSVATCWHKATSLVEPPANTAGWSILWPSSDTEIEEKGDLLPDKEDVAVATTRSGRRRSVPTPQQDEDREEDPDDLDEDQDPTFSPEDEADDNESTIAEEERLHCEGDFPVFSELVQLNMDLHYPPQALVEKLVDASSVVATSQDDAEMDIQTDGEQQSKVEDEQDGEEAEQGDDGEEDGEMDSENETSNLIAEGSQAVSFMSRLKALAALAEKTLKEFVPEEEEEEEENEKGGGTEKVNKKRYWLAPVLVPKDKLNELCRYHFEALRWLIGMYLRRLGAVIADDRGLGKETAVVLFLASLAGEKGVWGPHLILTSRERSLSWEIELLSWCPSLRVSRGKPDSSSHVLILTYEDVYTAFSSFQRVQWHTVVWDLTESVTESVSDQAERKLPNLRCKSRVFVCENEKQAQQMAPLLMFALHPKLLMTLESTKEWAKKKVNNPWKDCVRSFCLARDVSEVTGLDSVTICEAQRECHPTYRQIVASERIKHAIEMHHKESGETVATRSSKGRTSKQQPKDPLDVASSIAIESIGYHTDLIFPRHVRTCFEMEAVSSAFLFDTVALLDAFDWSCNNKTDAVSPGAMSFWSVDETPDIFHFQPQSLILSTTKGKKRRRNILVQATQLASHDTQKIVEQVNNPQEEVKKEELEKLEDSTQQTGAPMDEDTHAVAAETTGVAQVKNNSQETEQQMENDTQMKMEEEEKGEEPRAVPKLVVNIGSRPFKALSLLDTRVGRRMPVSRRVRDAVTLELADIRAKSGISLNPKPQAQSLAHPLIVTCASSHIDSISTPCSESSSQIPRLPHIDRSSALRSSGVLLEMVSVLKDLVNSNAPFERKVLVVAHNHMLLDAAEHALCASQLRFVRLDEDGPVRVARMAALSRNPAVKIGLAQVSELEDLMSIGLDVESGLGVCSAAILLDRNLDPEATSEPVADLIQEIAVAYTRRCLRCGIDALEFMALQLEMQWGEEGSLFKPLELNEIKAAIKPRGRKQPSYSSLTSFVEKNIAHVLGRSEGAMAAANIRVVGQDEDQDENDEDGEEQNGSDQGDSQGMESSRTPELLPESRPCFVAIDEVDVMKLEYSDSMCQLNQPLFQRVSPPSPLASRTRAQTPTEFQGDGTEDKVEEKEREQGEAHSNPTGDDGEKDDSVACQQPSVNSEKESAPSSQGQRFHLRKRDYFFHQGEDDEEWTDSSDDDESETSPAESSPHKPKRFRRASHASSVSPDETLSHDLEEEKKIEEKDLDEFGVGSVNGYAHRYVRDAELIIIDRKRLPTVYRKAFEATKSGEKAEGEDNAWPLEEQSSPSSPSWSSGETDPIADDDWLEDIGLHGPLFFDMSFDPVEKDKSFRGFLKDLDEDPFTSSLSYHVYGPPSANAIEEDLVEFNVPPGLPVYSYAGASASTSLPHPKFVVNFINEREITVEGDVNFFNTFEELGPLSSQTVVGGEKRSAAQGMDPNKKQKLDLSKKKGPGEDLFVNVEEDLVVVNPGSGKDVDWNIQVPKLKKANQKKDKVASDGASWTAWEDASILRAVEVYGPNWDLVASLVTSPFGLTRTNLQVMERYHKVRSEHKSAASCPWVREKGLQVKDIANWASPPLHVTDLLLNAPLNQGVYGQEERQFKAERSSFARRLVLPTPSDGEREGAMSVFSLILNTSRSSIKYQLPEANPQSPRRAHPSQTLHSTSLGDSGISFLRGLLDQLPDSARNRTTPVSTSSMRPTASRTHSTSSGTSSVHSSNSGRGGRRPAGPSQARHAPAYPPSQASYAHRTSPSGYARPPMPQSAPSATRIPQSGPRGPTSVSPRNPSGSGRGRGGSPRMQQPQMPYQMPQGPMMHHRADGAYPMGPEMAYGQSAYASRGYAPSMPPHPSSSAGMPYHPGVAHGQPMHGMHDPNQHMQYPMHDQHNPPQSGQPPHHPHRDYQG